MSRSSLLRVKRFPEFLRRCKLSKLAGKVFRIGHLGDFNDLMLMGTLNGIEMGFEIAGIPYQKGGIAKATEILVNK